MNCTLFSKTRDFLSQTAVRFWWYLPAGRQAKEQIKTITFSCLPFMFKNTRTFRNWQYTREMNRQDFVFNASEFPAHWPLEKIGKEFVEHTTTKIQHQNDKKSLTSPLAIIIHVYFEELLPELLLHLDVFRNTGSKLFVSTTPEKLKTVRHTMSNTGFAYYLEAFDNHGRDVLPFLKLSQLAVNEGYPLMLKLHTKKSDHRLSGDLWRREVYKRLLMPEAVDRLMQVFAHHPGLGMIGPAGHIVPMSLYYGGNALPIGYLSYRLQLEPQNLKEMSFVAGSMFYIRAEALKPLLALNLDAELFEKEQGQFDGTMAHAVERIFAVSNMQAGFVLADSNSKPDKLSLVNTNDHPFTW